MQSDEWTFAGRVECRLNQPNRPVITGDTAHRVLRFIPLYFLGRKRQPVRTDGVRGKNSSIWCIVTLEINVSSVYVGAASARVRTSLVRSRLVPPAVLTSRRRR